MCRPSILAATDSGKRNHSPGIRPPALLVSVGRAWVVWRKSQKDGQRFRNIFSGRIESGWLYELNGRWLEADDPRVIARKAETSLRGSPAFSAVNGGCVSPPLPI